MLGCWEFISLSICATFLGQCLTPSDHQIITHFVPYPETADKNGLIAPATAKALARGGMVGCCSFSSIELWGESGGAVWQHRRFFGRAVVVRGIGDGSWCGWL